MKNLKRPRAPWAVFALVTVIVAGALVLALFGAQLTDTAKVLIIGQMMGWVPGILALMKTENVQNDIRNGVMAQNVKEAITELAEPVQNSDGETVAMIVAPTYTGPDRRH